MKKNIFLLIVLLASISSNIMSQSVYPMRITTIEGMGEKLYNTKLGLNYYGIAFESGNKIRGTVSNNGQWLFLNPSSDYTADQMNNINQKLSESPGVSIGTNGCVAASSFYLKNLSVSSATQLKIERNSNGLPVIYSSAGQLRLGGTGGVRIWGNDGCYNSDTPHFMVNSEKIESNVPTYVKRSGVSFLMNHDADADDFWIGTTTNHGLYLGTNNSSSFYIDKNRRVYIGASEDFIGRIRAELKNKYYMFVGKGILSEDFAIAPASSWSDFVFDKDYRLPAIEEVESFIEENNHLPDVPSAAEVAEEGYSQHDMNKVLLQKIEELTLYTIQQQKEIKALKSELNELKK